MTREQARQRLIGNNRKAFSKIQQLLTDQAAWNEANPMEDEIDVNQDGILSLCIAWLDQQYEELKADMHPISDPPPRLAAYLESLESEASE
jgi:hypothetical protein